MDVPGHADMIDSILDDARADRCRIFTSTVALAEVTRGRHGSLAVDRTNEDKIANFSVKYLPVYKNLAVSYAWLQKDVFTRAAKQEKAESWTMAGLAAGVLWLLSGAKK